MRRRWTKEEAWKWYSSRPWVMGLNYVPSITLHCAELWQEDTHDEVMKSVKKEFSLMEDIGLNSVRMFMPFSIWYYDREKFLLRLDKFLTALDKHGISMMPVIFNDCVGFGKPEDIRPKRSTGWHSYDIGHHGGHKDNPFTGERKRQGWIYWDEEEWRPVMVEYLQALVGRFRCDGRIYAWDIWNEPGNSNRHNMSVPYLKRAFEITRELDPIQPLTAGVWFYPQDYGISWQAEVESIQRLALDESDIITFHQYEGFERVKNVVARLKAEERPMLNTEWLNRVQNNLMEDNLPLYYDEKIGSYSWGLVAGKSQHFLPWDELWKNKSLPLNRWQHDLFDTFYTPYDRKELDLMRSLSPKNR